MADDVLDTLYSVQPGSFTAERTKLAAAAKARGDDAAAKRISASRKPTTAAWVVNRLAIEHRDVKERLTDLGDRLRAAHTAMDGQRIRELSTEQHGLLEELARAAFDGVTASAAVREDVIGTLQAAIADPEVRNRLGRLDRPEQWSGFGTFDDTAGPATSPAAKTDDQRMAKLSAAVAEAEDAKAKADGLLATRQAERDQARLRRDEALAALRRAERETDRAEKNVEKARQASRAAADAVREAKAQRTRT
ncbi:hypothetical protein A5647_13850 [Mycobacterium sp. 1100029.7]|nr:hypothetical protein A5647_13850 [Mycobacterium sp. 1100029.7]